jgi:hypothetical protein
VQVEHLLQEYHPSVIRDRVSGAVINILEDGTIL